MLGMIEAFGPRGARRSPGEGCGKKGEAAGGRSGSRGVAGTLGQQFVGPNVGLYRSVVYAAPAAASRPALTRLRLALGKSLRIVKGCHRHLLMAFKFFVGLLSAAGGHGRREP